MSNAAKETIKDALRKKGDAKISIPFIEESFPASSSSRSLDIFKRWLNQIDVDILGVDEDNLSIHLILSPSDLRRRQEGFSVLFGENPWPLTGRAKG